MASFLVKENLKVSPRPEESLDNRLHLVGLPRLTSCSGKDEVTQSRRSQVVEQCDHGRPA